MTKQHASKANGSGHPQGTLTQQRYTEELVRARELNEQGKPEQAEQLALALLQQGAATPEIFNLLGGIALSGKRYDDAILRLKQAVVSDPRNSNHHYNLGVAQQMAEKTDEAIQSYTRAALLQPNHEGANFQAARLLQREGRSEEALPYVIRLCKANPLHTAYWYLYVQVVWGAPQYEQEKELREPLEKALAEELTSAVRSAALRLLSFSGWSEELDRLFKEGEFNAIEGKLSDPDFLKKMQDPVLLNLMARSHIPSPVMDYILNQMRRQLLLSPGLAQREELRSLLLAMWQLCFVNEYVFLAEEDELATLPALRDEISMALNNKEIPDITSLALFGSYTRLVDEGFAKALCEAYADDSAISDILREQIAEPLDERKRMASIPTLLPITDETTRQVREQYEKNPYPRWRELAENTPCSIEGYLARTLAQHSWQPVPANKGEVLVAGCGTGQHAIEVARQLAESEVLAVDISQASMAYAQRKAEELGVGNLRFLQADILDLDKLDKQFDVIESVGVLHHMRDPMEGWRRLVSLLRPGGVMKIGLYSSIARRAVNMLRKEIAEQNIGGDDEAIRQFRRSVIMRTYEGSDTVFAPGKTSMQEVFFASDFYTLSECRDLLFHVQEHQFTLPEIKTAIESLGVEFLGIHRMDETRHGHFHHTLPPNDRSRDLDAWHNYERAHPDTFRSMYRFWLQKPPKH